MTNLAYQDDFTGFGYPFRMAEVPRGQTPPQTALPFPGARVGVFCRTAFPGRQESARKDGLERPSYTWKRKSQFPLERVLAGLAGADPHRVSQVGHEDLAVAHLARFRRARNALDDLRQIAVGDHDLDLDLGDEIDGVLRAAVHFRVPLLAAEAADLGHGHAV